MRKQIILICDECLSRNYRLSKNKFSDQRLELNKYCPTCRKVTKHKETK